MYTFSSKLKTFSFALMVLGAIGIGVGFWQAPKTIEDVEKILADSHHGHETAHVEKVAHDTEAHAVTEPAHGEVAVVDSTKVITQVIK